MVIMGNMSPACVISAFVFLLCLSLSPEARGVTNEGNQGNEHSNGNRNSITWCIVKPPVDEQRLENNIQYSCSQPRMDCSLIQIGGQCYYPYQKYLHASVVMNKYYKINGQPPYACDFAGTGLIISQDPSYGNCRFD